jgi:uncharacterized protein (TIGR02646 family)
VIRVVRAAKPKVLRDNESRWLSALKAAVSAGDRERATARYRHAEVRVALEQMFRGKCAYCESYILHITYAHIEHFRPKSRFPELTFSWENLLLACGICNSSRFKADRFPEAADGGPIVDPCTEEPEDHLVFHYHPRARLASVYGRTVRGQTTERFLGLNRPELRCRRSRQVTLLAVLRLHVDIDERARELFEEAKAGSEEYAAFARAMDNWPSP